MHPNTGEPQDTLTPKAKQLIQDLGSRNTKVSDIIAQEDQAVFTAIQEGLDKANKCATSKAQMVCIPCIVLVELTLLLSMRVWSESAFV